MTITLALAELSQSSFRVMDRSWLLQQNATMVLE
jgi:hypothetical protein